MLEEIKVIETSEAQKEFIKLRRKMDNIADTTPQSKVDEVFAESFSKIYMEATMGDVICQDYLGYIFKRGKPYLVPENIDLSMKWLILAAANGNNLSIDRLAIFLNYAYDEIVYLEDFGNIKLRNGIDEDNYLYVLGRVMCEAIVDELNINAFQIIKEIPDTLEFNSVTMGIYDKARNKVLPRVISYLRGKNPSLEKPLSQKVDEKLEKEKEEAKANQPKKESMMDKVFKKKDKKEDKE